MTIHLINEALNETYCGISAKFFKPPDPGTGEAAVGVRYCRGPITQTVSGYYQNDATRHVEFVDCDDCKEEYGLVLLERL